MAKSVTLRDANQNFAKYIRAAESGEEFVITRRGEPVAKITPIAGRRVLTPSQEAARKRMVRRLKKGMNLGGEKFDRNSLYER